jgi:hypothetical protein
MSFFHTIEGQLLGASIGSEGTSALEVVLNSRNLDATTLGACCEFIAGTVDRKLIQGKCYLAELWAYQNQFIPKPSLVKKAQLAATEIKPICESQLYSSICKSLALKQSTAKLKSPGSSKSALKKLFDDDFGTVTFDGIAASVNIWGKWTIPKIISICYYPAIESLEASFDDSEPSESEIVAFRMFLLRYKDCLEMLSFDRAGLMEDVVRDPNKLLLRSVPQLRSLQSLEMFTSQYLFVDDHVIEAIADRPLSHLSVEPAESLSLTFNGLIQSLENCDEVKLLSVESEELTKKEGEILAKKFPDASIYLKDYSRCNL